LPRVTEPTQSSRRIALVLFFVFLGFSAFTTLQHEMWRDELQAWMLGRDSATLAQLFANVRYEGHPPLWHLCLFLISSFTESPGGMQVLHVVIATGSAFLVLRFGPFALWQKCLFIFGYFPFYEYCVKSRGYALGILLMFAFCILFQRRVRDAQDGSGEDRTGTRLVWMSVVLALLCHTSVLAATIAVGFALVLVLDIQRGSVSQPSIAPSSVWIATGVFTLGIGTAVVSVLPPADGDYAGEILLRFDPEQYGKVISRVAHAYLPLLGNTLYLVRTRWDHLAAYCFLLWSVALLWRRPLALFFYVITTLTLLGFFYMKYRGLLWHHGHLYLIWFLSLWLARAYDRDESLRGASSGESSGTSPDAWRRLREGSIFAVLLVHVVTGVHAHVREWKEPFSAAKETAAFLRTYEIRGDDQTTVDRGSQKRPLAPGGDRARTDERRDGSLTPSASGESWLLAGDVDYLVSAVVGYLPKGTKMFYIAGARFGTFIRWDTARATRIPSGWQAFAFALDKGRELGSGVLFVSSYEVPADLTDEVREVSRHDRSLWPNERFYVYELTLPHSQPGPGHEPPRPPESTTATTQTSRPPRSVPDPAQSAPSKGGEAQGAECQGGGRSGCGGDR